MKRVKKIKLTKVEQRAHDACETYARWGHGDFQVHWVKSKTWGNVPHINWRNEKASYASGCGYDKLSAVVADFLKYLPGAPNAGLFGGCGISSLQDYLLLDCGWKLVHVYDGKTEDGFNLTKIGAPE